ncbi:MAG: DNA repair and recombination protein RadA, partial [Thermoplasmata archaeon]|nr:DNA repair and recombination protein RadA [Thermoplasmata archaeon]
MTKETGIDELPGVGPATAEKLREAGFRDLFAIAVASPSKLAENTDIGKGTAEKIIRSAREMADVGSFETGDVLMERRKEVKKLTTSAKALDELLGGGFESQAITEMYGEFGCGKTQLVHQLSVNVQLPLDQGGLESHSVIIDTENTFRPERIEQMALAHGLEPKDVLENIHVARAFNSHHQMLLVDKAFDLAEEFPVRLLVVDSLTAHFRAEYLGRGALSERQPLLNRHM